MQTCVSVSAYVCSALRIFDDARRSTSRCRGVRCCAWGYLASAVRVGLCSDCAPVVQEVCLRCTGSYQLPDDQPLNPLGACGLYTPHRQPGGVGRRGGGCFHTVALKGHGTMFTGMPSLFRFCPWVIILSPKSSRCCSVPGAVSAAVPFCCAAVLLVPWAWLNVLFVLCCPLWFCCFCSFLSSGKQYWEAHSCNIYDVQCRNCGPVALLPCCTHPAVGGKPASH